MDQTRTRASGPPTRATYPPHIQAQKERVDSGGLNVREGVGPEDRAEFREVKMAVKQKTIIIFREVRRNIIIK